MEKSVKITLIIAVTILVLGILGFVAWNSLLEHADPSNSLTTQGSYTIKVVPNMISVALNVQTNAKNAESAKENNTVITNSLINKLVALGFNKNDIKTESYNIYPDYEWVGGTSKTKGYVVSHLLRVEINSNKSELVGQLIDSGVESGALISYINFELSKDFENKYKVEALEKATLDARNRAEAITRGLNKRIGDVVAVSSSDFNYYPWNTFRLDDKLATPQGSYSAAKEAIAGNNIVPSERDITASVSVTFKMK